jgi:aldehyde dehydrogenase (NAD+)
LVRLLGNELRARKNALAAPVSAECGKILEEGLGEVQEMIDICDFAVGLSRQLYGLTMLSERLGHSMREIWHPMGVYGVITVFNFPVAVWAWNVALALVFGNSVIWKPSKKTPLTAIAVRRLVASVVADFLATQNGRRFADHAR